MYPFKIVPEKIANFVEDYWILKLNTLNTCNKLGKNPFGLNQRLNQQNKSYTKKTRLLQSKKRKLHFQKDPIKSKEYLIGENNPNYKGKSQTKETRQILREQKLSWWDNHPEYREIQSIKTKEYQLIYGNTMKGKNHSDESKEKNRQSHLGKKASLETRKKMSESTKKLCEENPELLPPVLYGKDNSNSKMCSQYDLEYNWMRDWDCRIEAVKYFKSLGLKGDICYALKDFEKRTAFGFRWKNKGGDALC